MINDIKKLRQETGVGMMECKSALEACNGDIEKAKVHLRKIGAVKAGQRGHKAALEGVIGTYSHTGGRICAVIELNSETGSVAQCKDFQTFAHDLAIHIAASDPKWISREDVPQPVIDTERDILSVGLESKPEHIREKILNGKLDKFFKTNCLMEQNFIKDPKVTIQDLYNDLVMRIRENIVIKRFVRFEVGAWDNERK